MRLTVLALALGLSVHAASLAADPKPTDAAKQAPPVAITGKVTGPDGKPIANAAVLALPMPRREVSFKGPRPDVPKAAAGKSDAAGSFKIEGLAGGPFAVRVAAAGLAPTVLTDIPAGASVNVRLKPGVAVAGRVLDLTTQKPIAGATVTGLE